MHTSFISHGRGVYFWLALSLTVTCSILYIVHDPVGEPNGGTWLGYTLGGLAAFLIVWLLYLGRRKRNFASSLGTIRGWVSAHVYFGLALLIVATLHTGFQFGWNIHTLAYVLMCVVIISGIFGVWSYLTLPKARNDLKDSMSLDELFLQLEDMDAQLTGLCRRAREDIRHVIAGAIERTEVGGSLIEQITGADRSRATIGGIIVSNVDQQAVIDWLVSRRADITGDEAKFWDDITTVYGQRRRLLKLIREDIRMSAWLHVWLFMHIPLSFALLMALIAHVFSVFVYW